MLQNLVGNVSVPDYDLACTGGGTRGSIMGQPFMIISSGIGPMQVGKGRAGLGRGGLGRAELGMLIMDRLKLAAGWARPSHGLHCASALISPLFLTLMHTFALSLPPPQAATCVQLAMTICPQRIKETFYIGTSGWPASIGGILNPDITCNTTNPNRGRGQVTRVGEAVRGRDLPALCCFANGHRLPTFRSSSQTLYGCFPVRACLWSFLLLSPVPPSYPCR